MEVAAKGLTSVKIFPSETHIVILEGRIIITTVTSNTECPLYATHYSKPFAWHLLFFSSWQPFGVATVVVLQRIAAQRGQAICPKSHSQ